MEHWCAKTLETLFADCFTCQWQTRLCGGAEEPLYQPAASQGELHTIYYRSDYFSSALHEIAHWCIAGPQRRLQLDYGYWYTPDGRNAEQQKAFEQVEARPQALELLFSAACGKPFRVSVDNLEGGAGEVAGFENKVLAHAFQYLQRGTGERADLWLNALLNHWQPRKQGLGSAMLDYAMIEAVFRPW